MVSTPTKIGKKKFTTALDNSIYNELKEIAPKRGDRMRLISTLVHEEYLTRKVAREE